MSTWTQHKLTDAQLGRLSELSKGRGHHHGVALDALVRKGLAQELPSDEHQYFKPKKWVPGMRRTHKITSEGQAALDLARMRGW